MKVKMYPLYISFCDGDFLGKVQKVFKVTVYSLLMNYSYHFFWFWAENLMLAQISVIDCNSAPKIVSCSEKLEFIGQSDAFCG